MLENDATRCMNSEADDEADLNEDKSIDTEKEVNVVGKSLRSLLFRKKMKRLSPHHCPLKDQMRDKMVSYVDLLQPGPPPSRKDDGKKSESSKRLATRR